MPTTVYVVKDLKMDYYLGAFGNYDDARKARDRWVDNFMFDESEDYDYYTEEEMEIVSLEVK